MSNIEYKDIKTETNSEISAVGRRYDGVSGEKDGITIISKKHRSQLDNKKEVDNIFKLVGQPTTNTFEDLKNKIARYEKLTLNWDMSSLTSDQRCELYELWGWAETETSLKNNLGDN